MITGDDENDQVRTGMVMCRGMRAVSAQWAESRRLQPSTIDNKHTCVMTSTVGGVTPTTAIYSQQQTHLCNH